MQCIPEVLDDDDAELARKISSFRISKDWKDTKECDSMTPRRGQRKV